MVHYFVFSVFIVMLGERYQSAGASRTYKMGNDDNMFIQCDVDSDRSISRSELTNCLSSTKFGSVYSYNPTGSDKLDHGYELQVEKAMQLLDTNKDNAISMGEFHLINQRTVESMNFDDTITVVKADGTEEEVPKEKFFQNIRDTSEGMEMKNEKMFKQEFDSGSREEMTRKNPALGNMMRIGQWSAKQLIELNHAEGHLLSMKSFPNGGSVVDPSRLEKEVDALGVHFQGAFELWLQLVVGSHEMDTSTDPPTPPSVITFEVHIGYSKELYRKPYLTLLDAWVIRAGSTTQSGDNTGSTGSTGSANKLIRIAKLDLPPPRVIEPFSVYARQQLYYYGSLPTVQYSAILLLTLLAIATIFEFW